ncbi:MAG: hypothetical protein GF383_11575 [Candidatus Lokiarchaeota archaeon]|nr:hypothetical protein [Candidatus Lokiarchaeota archaeon]MBD3341376.1 hypothetical protein [Candidatus Lokiarchaeota archaeon]
MKPIEKLKAFLVRLEQLWYMKITLDWDFAYCRPKKTRYNYSHMLASLIKEKLRSDEFGKIIKAAEAQKDLTENQIRLVRNAKRDYQISTNFPKNLQKGIQGTFVDLYNLDRFNSSIEALLKLLKRYAQKISLRENSFDTLIALEQPCLTSEIINRMISNLKPLIRTILHRYSFKTDRVNTCKSTIYSNIPIFKGYYNKKIQLKLIKLVLLKLGFNFDSGEMIENPNNSGGETYQITPGDTRITFPLNSYNLIQGLFVALHECGHYLHIQGRIWWTRRSWRSGSAYCSSPAIFEAIGILYQNFLGHNIHFWEWLFPIFQQFFPKKLKNYPLNAFLSELREPQPSYSMKYRSWDEVSYLCYDILQFEIGRDLFNGTLKVQDLADRWYSDMEDMLGISPPLEFKRDIVDLPNITRGELTSNLSYILGAIYAAQLWAHIHKSRFELHTDFKQGNFRQFHQDLRKKIFQYGGLYNSHELLKEVTNESINSNYLKEYLKSNYL